MSNAIASFGSRQGLRALDPDLPFLASEAAIDIDNMLAGVGVRSQAISDLAELLNTSIDLSPGGSFTRSQIDPGTLTVLGRL